MLSGGNHEKDSPGQCIQGFPEKEHKSADEINHQHIPILYHLGKQKKQPMTKLVDQAIAEYLSKEENKVRVNS